MTTHTISTPELSLDFAAFGAPKLVYVREITAREALAGEPQEAFEQNHLTPDQVIYAVHGADGQRLALLGDRQSAFAAAFANELAPVSVH